ncbi:MAG: Rossmann-like and DUF2520 domain-containing protein [Planctomycetota bacterium]
MSRRRNPRVAILGAGAVGTTVGRALRKAGWPVVAACRRDRGRARRAAHVIGGGCSASTSPARAVRDADLVLLTMADTAIAGAAADLAAGGGVRSGTLVVHASGAVPSAVLEPLRLEGVRLASLHPLQHFAGTPSGPRDPGTDLGGVWWFHEGEAPSTCRSLAKATGGRMRSLPAGSKALYHAAAVASSNYLVVVQDLAARLAAAAGVPAEESLQALLPLVKGTVTNLESRGLPDALTGPVSRGDASTVKSHREALRGLDPALDALYAALGRHALRVAKEQGLDSGRARRTSRALADEDGPRR